MGCFRLVFELSSLGKRHPPTLSRIRGLATETHRKARPFSLPEEGDRKLEEECSVILEARPVQSSSLSRHISERVQTVHSLTSVLVPEAGSPNANALWWGVCAQARLYVQPGAEVECGAYIWEIQGVPCRVT